MLSHQDLFDLREKEKKEWLAETQRRKGLRQAGKKLVSSSKTLYKQDARDKKQEKRGKERLDFFAAWRLCVRKKKKNKSRKVGKAQSFSAAADRQKTRLYQVPAVGRSAS